MPRHRDNQHSRREQQSSAQGSEPGQESRAGRSGRRAGGHHGRRARGVFSFRLGEDEVNELASAATSQDLTLSDFVRQAALEAARRVNGNARPAPSLADLRAQLDAIAATLHHLEAGGGALEGGSGPTPEPVME